jgi:hypothetical protein
MTEPFQSNYQKKLVMTPEPSPAQITTIQVAGLPAIKIISSDLDSFGHTVAHIEYQKQLAKQRFEKEITNLLSGGKQVQSQAAINLKKHEKAWQQRWLPALGFEPAASDQEGLFASLKPANLANLQFRALTEPASFAPETWQAFPNKHFESVDTLENGDWQDLRQTPGDFSLLKLNLQADEQALTLAAINRLESNNWQEWTSIAAYPGSGFDPNNRIEITLKVPPAQITKLKELKKQIVINQNKNAKNLKQVKQIAEIMRPAKTAKNLTEDPTYIHKHLLQPTLIKLKEVRASNNPVAVYLILRGLKLKIKSLLLDMIGLQSSTQSHLEANKYTFAQAEQKVLNKIISQISQKIVNALEISTGKHLLEHFSLPNLMNKSPLGPVPEDGYQFADSKDQAKQKFYQSAIQLFSQSKEPINLKHIMALIADPEINLADLYQKPDQNKTHADNLSQQAYFKATGKDLVIQMAEYSKQAYTEVFEVEQNYRLLKVQFGFIPFATNAHEQEQIEALLTDSTFSSVFQASQNQALPLALLSRLKYLHFRYAKG